MNMKYMTLVCGIAISGLSLTGCLSDDPQSRIETVEFRYTYPDDEKPDRDWMARSDSASLNIKNGLDLPALAKMEASKPEWCKGRFTRSGLTIELSHDATMALLVYLRSHTAAGAIIEYLRARGLTWGWTAGYYRFAISCAIALIQQKDNELVDADAQSLGGGVKITCSYANLLTGLVHNVHIHPR